MWNSLPANDICERARQSRDARFDGRFFVAVLTTGIFCRPTCPARTPAAENVRYFPSVATALEAGDRPCLRCRPELAPDAPPVADRSRTVQAALSHIEAGALDEGSVAALAARVGLSSRQLTRQFVAELGVAPGAVARARRIAVARQLIDETELPFTRIAALAGFGSLRRFNETVQALWSRPPGALRRAKRPRPGADDPRAGLRDTRGGGSQSPIGEEVLRLQLALRPPYHQAWMLEYLRGRAVPGVEAVQADTWVRTLPSGELRVRLPAPDGTASQGGGHVLQVSLSGDLGQLRLADVLRRVRRVFDVGADGRAIDAHLGAAARLRDVVGRDPGLRVPGGWDGFELAVRAVLGQQVSVAGATTLAGRLVQRFGAPAGEGRALFPDAHALVDANVAAIGMPETRGEAIRQLARATLDGRVQLDAALAPEELAAQLVALPGIGPWTAQYVAMRALGHPDAFPAEDIVLRKVADPERLLSARELLHMAETWRPWRAYAVMYLWRDAGHRRAAAARARTTDRGRTAATH